MDRLPPVIPIETFDMQPEQRRKLRYDAVEKLRRRVLADEGYWKEIALAAEVDYRTLLRFVHGYSRRPRHGFLQKLHAYYRKRDARS